MIRAPGLVPGGFLFGASLTQVRRAKRRSAVQSGRCGSGFAQGVAHEKHVHRRCASCERPSIQYARLRRPQRVPAKGTAGLRSARSVRAGAIVVALRPCRIRTPQSHEGTVRPGGRQPCAVNASEIPARTLSTSSPSGMSFDDDVTHGRAISCVDANANGRL